MFLRYAVIYIAFLKCQSGLRVIPSRSVDNMVAVDVDEYEASNASLVAETRFRDYESGN